MTKSWLSTKDIMTVWEKLVISKSKCNCDECIESRTRDIWHTLVLQAYPKLGFVPRIRDMTIGYYHYDQDARYERPGRALQLTLANMSRLRNSNKKAKKLFLANNKDVALRYCRDCGVVGKEKTGLSQGYEWYCPACASRYVVCHDCGSLLNSYRNKIVKLVIHCGETSKTVKMCSACSSKYLYCSYCNFSYLKDSIVKIPYQRRSNTVNTYNVCTECIGKVGTDCVECGCLTVSAIGSVEENGDMVCPACTEDRESLMSHNYQPLVQKFHKGKVEGNVSSSGLFFGFELEVDSWGDKNPLISESSMASFIKKRIGCKRIYVVRDGTIARDTNRHGIEIVSNPFTWSRYKKEDKLIWDDMLMLCRIKHWKSSTKRCGMHIHTTKAAWGTLQLYKLLQFVYNSRNYKFMTFVAQREPNRYCAMSMADYDNAAYIAKNKKNRTREHYNIINLNNKRGGEGQTIEFRMFKGTLEPLYFHKNIEFVHALFHFTRDYPNSKMLYKHFVEYVKKNKYIYPHFTEYMKLGGRLCV